MRQMGLRYFKKGQNPARPEKSGHSGSIQLPFRTGQQDTPLKPRHRRYFNAPIGATQGKTGWGDIDDAESRRARPARIDGPPKQLEYPIDKSLEHQEVEKKARRAFGKQAVHGQPIRRPTYMS